MAIDSLLLAHNYYFIARSHLWLGIADLLVPAPDQTAVETYLGTIYHHWQQQQQQHRHEEKLLAQQLLAQGAKGDPEQEVTRQISFLSEKNVHMGKALRESRQIKGKFHSHALLFFPPKWPSPIILGLLVNVEEELTSISNTIDQNEKQNVLPYILDSFCHSY